MHNEKGGGLCPAAWKPGEQTIIANDAKKLESFWKDVHAKK
jgi:alkyl hydroperoxide reductase subunit AhpC